MKTKQYISATLIALVFATAGMQAQTARRSGPQEKERPGTTTTQVKENNTQKARSTQPARQVNTAQARQNNAKAPARQVNTAQARNLSSAEQRPGGMTTARTTNPRPRQATNVSYATPRFSAPKHTAKYHNRVYYGGHYYHYAYPTTKVRFNYHYDTYVHHYNVLYYPAYTDIYWTRSMYRDYHRWYPEYRWTYNYGYRIQTISIFDAQYYLGEVAMVYGRVYATWHNRETDDYLLFFGGDFPYQKFTVVIPGHVARRFSWRPERYFLGQHMTTTGLITTYDGSPEIVVKHKRQVGIY